MQHSQIQLRRTEQADLDYFFDFQLDEEACRLAAFVSADHANREAYLTKYTRFLHDPTITMQTILVAGRIVGSIAKFEVGGEAGITYWLDRSVWGRGIATFALQAFLAIKRTRPIVGRVAFDNVGSQKVLKNCGFVQVGMDKGFAYARQTEVEEFIYQLG